jgi:multidrug efflux pump subunit AcrB
MTAGTVVAGSFVMVFDPIFQGLALSLMFGATLSTILTVVVIPLAYFLHATRFKGKEALTPSKPEG